MPIDAVNQQYTSSVNTLQKFGATPNIPEMGLLIQMERHDILQTQVQDQFKDMQARNQWLKEATAALNELRTERQEKTDGAAIPLSSLSIQHAKPDGTTSSMNLEDFFKSNGIAYPPRALSQADVDTCISNLKASIDTVNTNSQMDMVRMQGLMDKLNQSIDFMTNWTSKNTKSMDSIIGNIR
jgi:chaperonin cofactor prefoldin